jgi:hypothetical protein
VKPAAVVEMANAAFASDAAATPRITLRGGEALDRYDEPPPFDPAIDETTDAYLLKYSDGLTFLDAASWRHYLPYLIQYAVHHIGQGNDLCDVLLNNLRPPDREPPRLSSLSPEQEKAVTAFLDFLAFCDSSPHQDFACQVLEEWWVPGALYRKP